MAYKGAKTDATETPRAGTSMFESILYAQIRHIPSKLTPISKNTLSDRQNGIRRLILPIVTAIWHTIPATAIFFSRFCISARHRGLSIRFAGYCPAGQYAGGFGYARGGRRRPRAYAFARCAMFSGLQPCEHTRNVSFCFACARKSLAFHRNRAHSPVGNPNRAQIIGLSLSRLQKSLYIRHK